MDKIVPLLGLVVIILSTFGDTWNTGTVTKIDDRVHLDVGGYTRKVEIDDWDGLVEEGKIMLPAQEMTKKLTALRAEVDATSAKLKDAYGHIDYLKNRIDCIEFSQWEGRVIGVKADLKEDTIKIRLERGLGANTLPGGGTEVRVMLWQSGTPPYKEVKEAFAPASMPEAPVRADVDQGTEDAIVSGDTQDESQDEPREEMPEWMARMKEEREAHPTTVDDDVPF